MLSGWVPERDEFGSDEDERAITDDQCDHDGDRTTPGGTRGAVGIARERAERHALERPSSLGGYRGACVGPLWGVDESYGS